jgi:hypothetical protein
MLEHILIAFYIIKYNLMSFYLEEEDRRREMAVNNQINFELLINYCCG